MKLNFFKPVTEKLMVNLSGINYPITVTGNGKLNCFIPGIGTLMQRTLSPEFLKAFTVYSTDTYWVKNGALSDPTSLTMDKIVEDILESAKQLKLGEYFLLGNSCFGTVAIEVAKRQDASILGVIAVAAPPGWNQWVTSKAEEYFNTHATDERKARHTKLREEYEKIKSPEESIVSVGAYYADSAKYFAKEEKMADVMALWNDVECDDKIMNHFFGKLLPEFDLAKGMDTVHVPVIMAAGEEDYDSAPLELWKSYPLPTDFQVVNCKDAGHWPHNENPEIFDKAVIDWATQVYSKKMTVDCGNVDSKEPLQFS